METVTRPTKAGTKARRSFAHCVSLDRPLGLEFALPIYPSQSLAMGAGKPAVKRARRVRIFVRALGPGLVTGAADDDPSGIGTHSQIGAQFGYGLAWTFVLSFPLMVVIQEVAATIGRVTGAGIASNLKRHYQRTLWTMVSLLLVANIVNLGADLSAMGAALALLVG